jgi:hypothetical protein
MLDRRYFLASAGALIAAPAMAAGVTVNLPPVPEAGFRGAVVDIPPLPVDHARTHVKVAAGRAFRLSCCHATELVIEGVTADAYALDERRGIIAARQDIDAEATYKATAHRYDAFGSQGYVSGASRFIDPEEWGATGELYRLYVSRFGVEVIAVHAYRDGVRRDRLAEHRAWVETARKRLGGVLRKRGVKVMAYGHSIQAMGYRTPEMMVVANGASRDLMGYFALNATDTRAKFDQAGGHAREGYNYRLLERLDEPAYLNFAIPGTDSSANSLTDNGVVYGHGGFQPRLSAAIAMKPDIVVVDFAVNDINETGLYARYLRILNAFKSAGVARIVMAPPIENPSWRDRQAATLLVRDAIERAANDTGSVFVDVTGLYRRGEEGALGLSAWSHCAANLSNHPGRTELREVGRLLASLAD